MQFKVKEGGGSAAFLQRRPLEREHVVLQVQEFVEHLRLQEDEVSRLAKAAYGLVHAPRSSLRGDMMSLMIGSSYKLERVCQSSGAAAAQTLNNGEDNNICSDFLIVEIVAGRSCNQRGGQENSFRCESEQRGDIINMFCMCGLCFESGCLVQTEKQLGQELLAFRETSVENVTLVDGFTVALSWRMWPRRPRKYSSGACSYSWVVGGSY